MNYEKLTEGHESVDFVRLENVQYFDADMIFDCGQCFRFLPVDGTSHQKEWAGAAFGRFISVAQDDTVVTIYNTNADEFHRIWERFLSLDEDYSVYGRDITSRSDSQALGNAIEYGKGIRILKQDSWETLCSFIISQNNNIPRIRGLVDRLCREAGKKIDTTGMREHGAVGDVYSFPGAEEVDALGEDKLKEMKMGFRAGYIASVALDIVSGKCSLESVAKANDTQSASKMLETLRGVGPKVAACALLFGFGRLDAFPIDVWIKKVIAKYFPGEFSADMLGPYAGVAQQYLFYYERYLGGE